MKKVERKLMLNKRTGNTSAVYYVDGKRASLKTATQAEHANHLELVTRALDNFELSRGIESVALKCTDFNPRANDGVFVMKCFVEFCWRGVPAPSKGDDTDIVIIERGYKNSCDAVEAVDFLSEYFGFNLWRDGCRYRNGYVIDAQEPWCSCYQLMHRGRHKIILDETAEVD